MIYLPLAGRGEAIRLVAAAGDVELIETPCGMGEPLPSGESSAEYLSPRGTPVLKHGDFKMSQSLAIASYVASLSPKFNGLTAQQKATDAMYDGIKEELLANCAKALFTTKKGEDVTALFEKWMPLLEAKMPSDGFINGMDFPTLADVCMLNVTTGYMPFGAAFKLAGYDSSFASYPKFKSLVDRTAAALGPAFPTKHTFANPFNM